MNRAAGHDESPVAALGAALFFFGLASLVLGALAVPTAVAAFPDVAARVLGETDAWGALLAAVPATLFLGLATGMAVFAAGMALEARHGLRAAASKAGRTPAAVVRRALLSDRGTVLAAAMTVAMGASLFVVRRAAEGLAAAVAVGALTVFGLVLVGAGAKLTLAHRSAGTGR